MYRLPTLVLAVLAMYHSPRPGRVMEATGDEVGNQEAVGDFNGDVRKRHECS